MSDHLLVDGEPIRRPLLARYLIGIELLPGEIAPLADADSLVWGQALLIQIVTARRVQCGGDVIVLIDTRTGQVHERITMLPRRPHDA